MPVYPMYHVPFYTADIENKEVIDAELQVAYENSEFSMRADWGHTHYVSDPSFQEDFFAKHEASNFKKEIYRHVSLFLGELDYPEIIGLTTKCEIYSAWFSKFELGSYAQVHNHGHADISGVYYFKVPDNFGAELYFCSPMKVAEQTPCFSSLSQRLSIAPKEGKLILFPGWLEHGVKTNLSQEERVSVSFNVFLGKDEYKRMYA